MVDQLLTFNRQPLLDSFQQWRQENDAIDSELAESLAALEAYQSHLDQWQQELAAQRSDMEDERRHLEQAQETIALQESEIERLTAELAEAREESRDLNTDTSTPAQSTRTSDPILGSVLAQFDKLRRQQVRERKERRNRQ